MASISSPLRPIDLYTNNLKNREFDKEAPQIFWTRRDAVFVDTARGVDEKYEAKPTQSKLDSSSCLCIYAEWIAHLPTDLTKLLFSYLDYRSTQALCLIGRHGGERIHFSNKRFFTPLIRALDEGNPVKLAAASMKAAKAGKWHIVSFIAESIARNTLRKRPQDSAASALAKCQLFFCAERQLWTPVLSLLKAVAAGWVQKTDYCHVLLIRTICSPPRADRDAAFRFLCQSNLPIAPRYRKEAALLAKMQNQPERALECDQRGSGEVNLLGEDTCLLLARWGRWDLIQRFATHIFCVYQSSEPHPAGRSALSFILIQEAAKQNRWGEIVRMLQTYQQDPSWLGKHLSAAVRKAATPQPAVAIAISDADSVEGIAKALQQLLTQ